MTKGIVPGSSIVVNGVLQICNFAHQINVLNVANVASVVNVFESCQKALA